MDIVNRTKLVNVVTPINRNVTISIIFLITFFKFIFIKFLNIKHLKLIMRMRMNINIIYKRMHMSSFSIVSFTHLLD